jgi:cytochrome P450
VKRVVARDITVGGRDIKAGDSVTLWNISANRDPKQFDAPDEFDITRSPNRHLTYGNGIHRCVGATLAHLELTILLRRCIQDRVRFSLRGDVVRTRSNFILGVNSLPLGMTRESR